jgi:L-threonate 2-dehydrogenase
MTQTVGFIGLGRLGLPLAAQLVAAGYDVVAPSRGRTAELAELGGRIAGDGSARAVADVARVVCTCLPAGGGLAAAVEGDAGILAAREAPLVIDIGSTALEEKARIRDLLRTRGGDLLDAPISGTPDMAAAGKGVIYSSGDPATHERVTDVLKAMSPGTVYVGDFGAGSRLKHVSLLLACVHTAAAAEAMALAEAFGLDLHRVAEVVAASPGAASGQFAIRAPMLAEGDFEGRLVTVDTTREALDKLAEAAEAVDADIPLLSVVRRLLAEAAAAGEGQCDPGVVMRRLQAHPAGPTRR